MDIPDHLQVPLSHWLFQEQSLREHRSVKVAIAFGVWRSVLHADSVTSEKLPDLAEVHLHC